MFDKLGNWPEKYMLKYSSQIQKSGIQVVNPTKQPKTRKKTEDGLSLNLKKIQPSLWLFHPNKKSLFQTVQSNRN